MNSNQDYAILLKGTLEQDILDIFHREGHALNVLAVWDALARKGMQVPVLYLRKVLEAMVRFGLLEEAGEQAGQPAYRPSKTHAFERWAKPYIVGSKWRGMTEHVH